MATIQIPGPVFKITGSNLYKLSGASDEGMAGGVLVQVVNDNSLSATITVEAQSHAIEVAGATDQPVAVPYRSIYVNGAVGTGAYVTTGITTNSLIFIPGNGMTPMLSVAWTSGSATVYVTPVIGSCAF